MPPWPDAVPVLVAADVLVSEAKDEEKGRRTLGRWAALAFADPAARDEVVETLTRTVGAALGRRKPAGYYELGQPGDGVDRDPRATPARMADAWNAAMRELGYDARPQPAEDEDYFATEDDG